MRTITQTSAASGGLNTARIAPLMRASTSLHFYLVFEGTRAACHALASRSACSGPNVLRNAYEGV